MYGHTLPHRAVCGSATVSTGIDERLEMENIPVRSQLYRLVAPQPADVRHPRGLLCTALLQRILHGALHRASRPDTDAYTGSGFSLNSPLLSDCRRDMANSPFDIVKSDHTKKRQNISSNDMLCRFAISEMIPGTVWGHESARIMDSIISIRFPAAFSLQIPHFPAFSALTDFSVGNPFPILF